MIPYVSTNSTNSTNSNQLRSGKDLLKEVATSDTEVEYANQLVNTVISNLKRDSQSFQIASQTYNQAFFKDEPRYVRTALCEALSSFFAPTFNNSYWDHWKTR